MRTFLLVLLLAVARLALANDAAAQAQLIRQQQSDAFAMQLQQSIQSFRAGAIAPERRLELESLQRDQRLRQSDSFYRQQVQQQAQTDAPPPADMYRRAEQMRFEQERAADVDRARAEAASAVDRSRPPPQPAPNPEPAVTWGPVLR
ncbi:MAG TPA: hypothetical protein VLD36_08505 [Burkholderiales bacterium]|nr:hypothetical protein [Burkholderiales bacterium]